MTSQKITWFIGGEHARTVTRQEAGAYYPQTPMLVKIGLWPGGDELFNSPDVVKMAGGPVTYSEGPFSMRIRNMTVADYSRGSHYIYSDRSGTWQSIQAIGGMVNPAPPPLFQLTNAEAINHVASMAKSSATMVKSLGANFHKWHFALALYVIATMAIAAIDILY